MRHTVCDAFAEMGLILYIYYPTHYMTNKRQLLNYSILAEIPVHLIILNIRSGRADSGRRSTTPPLGMAPIQSGTRKRRLRKRSRLTTGSLPTLGGGVQLPP